MAVKTNPNKENNEKLRYKRQGHLIIDGIHRNGLSKDAIYVLLAKELGTDEPHAHLGRMQTIRELKRAYEALERIEKRIPRTVVKRHRASKVARPVVKVAPGMYIESVAKAPKTKKIKKDVLPREEMLKALEEIKKNREKLITGTVFNEEVFSVVTREIKKRGILQKIQDFFHEALHPQKEK